MAQDSLSLNGKIAIVTGSGKENGIGAGIAWALARAGAKVTINYVSESTAERAANVARQINAEIGQNTAFVVQADIGTQEGVQALVNKTLEQLGVDHIDILGRHIPSLLPRSAVLY
jgi:NAD(P)-dependent dehydrogenase (short-subunit alcohol dehydrogenase family)